MRVQGGTSGILSAFVTGRLDPLNAGWEPHRNCDLSTAGSEKRARLLRAKRRRKGEDRLQRLYDADMI